MKVETSVKRELLTGWAIRNVNRLGMDEVSATRKRIMRRTVAEVREFCKRSTKEGETS
jgi:hypothetical protein